MAISRQGCSLTIVPDSLDSHSEIKESVERQKRPVGSLTVGLARFVSEAARSSFDIFQLMPSTVFKQPLPSSDEQPLVLAKCRAADQMLLGVKDIVDCCVGGEQTLGRWGRFEALHFSLSSADRKMRVLRPVVFS
jgi:hypothetical protein